VVFCTKAELRKYVASKVKDLSCSQAVNIQCKSGRRLSETVQDRDIVTTHHWKWYMVYQKHHFRWHIANLFNSAPSPRTSIWCDCEGREHKTT